MHVLLIFKIYLIYIMKNFYLFFVSLLLLTACKTSSNKQVSDLAISNPIAVTMDLTAVVDDRVPVVVNPGRFTQDTVIYHLPRVVQGTYSVSDFGKYVDDLMAVDYQGNSMSVTKTDDNSWSITNATQVDKIKYLVNDTFDIEVSGGIGGEQPFSPAGTNISPDNYVLNLHGFIGYFDHLKSAQYTLDIEAPADFVRTSALLETGSKTSTDAQTTTTSYYAPRYFDITDNPMMYGKLEVETFMVGDIKIVLSVYSPNKMHSAQSLKETVVTMMEAQKAYLGDIDSTPRYDIYIYLAGQGEDQPKGFGALEHHTSTVVVMPEAMDANSLSKSIIDIVAHEFFHIVTPLSVHSEDIHYFDYNQPTFSKHLWMYEGVTEYFAQHFQVYKGLMTNEEFYEVITEKIQSSLNMDDDMSFTVMSENVLDEPYASNYYNVYQKGALIGMCIDILMREQSGGNRSMLSLMKELSLKYGKNKPFNDDDLIKEITAMTYPEVGEFLQVHVEGGTPINYADFFEKVGLEFVEQQVKTNYIQSGNAFIFGANQQSGDIFFNDLVLQNSFWASQDVQVGDIIKKVNGTELTMEAAQVILGGMYMWQPGMEIELELERNGELRTLKAALTEAFATGVSLQSVTDPTQAQLNLRNAWLKG